MGRFITVSSKKHRKVKESLDEKTLRAKAERASEILKKIPDEELIKAVRKSRDSR
jgi:hypothetical protein